MILVRFAIAWRLWDKVLNHAYRRRAATKNPFSLLVPLSGSGIFCEAWDIAGKLMKRGKK